MTCLVAVVAAVLGAALLQVGCATDVPPTPGPASKPSTRLSAPPAAYECRWAAAPVTIDGDGSDAAWAGAQVIDSFHLGWLGAGDRPSKTATRAKLLWDHEYLYFLADMDDADLHAEVTEHDGPMWEHDVFEIFLRPAADKPGYYEFEFNPRNAVLDMFLPSTDAGGWVKFAKDGDFDIKTAVKLRGTLNKRDDKDQGWTVEGRIAWRSLLRTGGRPEPGESWRFTLCRVDDSVGFDKQELSATAPLTGPKANFHSIDDYAPIRFVGPAGGSPSALPPLKTSKVVGSPEPPPPYRAVPAYPNLKLPFPIAISQVPGSDQLLALTARESYGRTQVVRFTDEPGVKRFEQLLDLDGVCVDLAYHPKFAENGLVYFGLNGPLKGPGPKRTKVVRYRMDVRNGCAIDPATATTVIEWDSDGHNGAALDFGPDGMLYVTSGDGTSDSDTNHAGQDLSKMLSKVLRIDVDHPDAGRHYSVPQDNPFVGKPGVVPETWCYGLRNPWRMKFDRKTGQLWLAQNGQDLWEQVYLIRKGANYGWSATEGSHPFYPDRKRGDGPVVPPTAEHSHAEARSLTGGLAYYGSAVSALAGAYVYGDYSTGKVWGIRHDGSKVTWHQEIADTRAHITGFGTNARGELLVVDYQRNDGQILKLEPSESKFVDRFPRKLSESGLFKSVRDHAMADGVLAYSVNAELWSDGAHKVRFAAIPGEGDARRVGFTTTGGFDFPDGTVLVKSFALEAEAGKPETRRWVETRFMTKQQGEWAGYSYEWDADGADATLVAAGGKDKPFDVRDPASPGGVRQQPWHYPSRAECMVCHSRAAGFVLGPSLVQMNKPHDYGGGRVVNQLAEWERLGLLKSDAVGYETAGVRNDAKARGLQKEALEAYVKAQGPQDGQRKPLERSALLPKDAEGYERLVDPYDASADLNARARSYLHSNCAICHIDAGGGNAAMELGFTRPQSDMRLIDAKPLHNAFGLPDARLVAPGAPERSVLMHRMSVRGTNTGQMPPVSTYATDDRGVALMREWIRSLPKSE
ncbi:MAG TPA: PQQ-dependent sugar dehydrogenase [Humisphaera sp.]